MKITAVSIQNFKCFQPNNDEFIPLSPLNLLVGKNNSGKSSVLEALDLLFHPTKIVAGGPEHIALCWHGNIKSPIYITFKCTFDEDELKRLFGEGSGIGPINYWRDIGRPLVGKPINAKINLTDLFTGTNNPPVHCSSSKAFFGENISPKIWLLIEKVIGDLGTHILQTLRSTYELYYVPSNRQIVHSADANKLDATGSNLAAIAHKYLSTEGLDHRLVERNLREKVLGLFPTLGSSFRIRTQTRTGTGFSHIVLEADDKPDLPVKYYGSALANVLIMMANLVFLEQVKTKRQIACIEEPENALHPELQRKLLGFFKDYFDGTERIGFIATHSPAMIDWSGNSTVCHLVQSDRHSQTEILGKEDISTLLDDLGVYASQILQSDAVIFVEGPTDRKAIQCALQKCDLNPDTFNISIVPLGGDVMRHVSPEMLVRVNRKIMFVVDSDKTAAGNALVKWKIDLADSCKKLSLPCIIDDSIHSLENAFPLESLRAYFDDVRINCSPYQKIDSAIGKYQKQRDTPKIAASLTREQFLASPYFKSIIDGVKSLIPAPI